MDARLRELIDARLADDDTLADEVGVLVLAACDGAAALADELSRNARTPSVAGPAPAPVTPPAAYLHSIAVEGFRGIGPRAELVLEPVRG